MVQRMRERRYCSTARLVDFLFVTSPSLTTCSEADTTFRLCRRTVTDLRCVSVETSIGVKAAQKRTPFRRRTLLTDSCTPRPFGGQ